MKGKRTKKEQVLTCILAATLLVSPLSSMGQVRAAETEYQATPEAVSEEAAEDKDYVVYIEKPDEDEVKVTDVSQRESDGTVSGNTADAGKPEVSDKENAVSDNTVSENTPAENTSEGSRVNNKDTYQMDVNQAAINDSGNQDETVDDNTNADVNADTDMEKVQESIEEAEALLDMKSDAEEVVKDEEAIVYEADLTKSEIKELEESDATIYVEENIELFGASGKNKKNNKKESGKAEDNRKEKETKEDIKKSTKKDIEKDTKKDEKKDAKKDTNKEQSSKKDNRETDSKNKKKKSGKQTGEDTGENQVKEPEWNIRMVHAVTEENKEMAVSDVTDSEVTGTTKTDTEATGTTTDTEPTTGTETATTGEKIKIAVMDSGIELLAGIPVQQINNMVASEEYLPYYMNDMTGHGTAIAGIIYDIAPNAEIYSVRIMDSENKATLSRVVEGIYWCIENDMDIINMSFGTQTESKVLEKAIKDADKAGILMVSSAGNGNTEGVEYPAAYGEVIAVGAVNTMAQKTEESAVGEEVELVAPGEQIISDSMLGLETVVSGTSMAAPHVTGAAAVLWQKDTTKSADFIRGLLSQAANSLGDAEEYGNGLVDLAYALEQYEEYEAGYQEAEETDAEQNDAEKADTIASGTELTEEMLIEENESPVETYEEVDYVEGRWGKTGHEQLVDIGAAQNGFSTENIAVFKLGAVYPDAVFKVDDDTANKVWHGGYGVNYIANYRFATRMAKYAGDVSKYQRARGQSDKDCTLMTSQVNHINVGENTYGSIINFTVGNTAYSYNSQSAAQQKKWRKIFLYGMASHIVADCYAHSAFCRCGPNNTLVKVNKAAKHLKQDDIASVHPTRFEDAGSAMIKVMEKCKQSELGSVLDFAPAKENQNKKRGYCLARVLDYARKANINQSDEDLINAYEKINCMP